MKLGLRSATLIALLLATAAKAEDKPVLVVATSSIDAILDDFGYVAEALGYARAGQMGAMMASQYIEGLDATRPVGMVLSTDGENFKPLAMLPIEDLDTFLEGMEDQLGEAEDAGNGILELAGPTPIYIKARNDWAYIAQSTDDLAKLPSDPLKQLAGLHKKYDIGVLAYVQNIPEEYREMALEQIKEGVELQMENLPEGDEDVQEKLVENSIRQWEAAMEGIEQLSLGIDIDSKGRQIVVDMTQVAVDGTKMGRQMAALQDSKTNFGGFLLKNAAIKSNISAKYPQEDVTQSLTMLDTATERLEEMIDESEDIPPAVSRDALKKLSKTIVEVAGETIKAGKVDTAMSVFFDSKGTMNAIGGGFIADGGKLEDGIKEFVGTLKGKGAAVELGFDQHAGVRFHKISIPIKEDASDDVKATLGDELEVIVGIAKEGVYFALGKSGLERLRKSIDASGGGTTKVLPFNMQIAVGPLVGYASKVDDNEMLAAMAAALENADDDKIVVVTNPIERGITFHMEVKEGVLSAVGEGIRAAQEDMLEE